MQERRLLAAGDSFNRVVVWNLLTSAVDRLLQVDCYGRLGEAGIDHVSIPSAKPGHGMDDDQSQPHGWGSS